LNTDRQSQCPLGLITLSRETPTTAAPLPYGLPVYPCGPCVCSRDPPRVPSPEVQRFESRHYSPDITLHQRIPPIPLVSAHPRTFTAPVYRHMDSTRIWACNSLRGWGVTKNTCKQFLGTFQFISSPSHGTRNHWLSFQQGCATPVRDWRPMVATSPFALQSDLPVSGQAARCASTAAQHKDTQVCRHP